MIDPADPPDARPHKARKGVTHLAPPQRALVIHPVRDGGPDRASRRLYEAVGLAQALDLEVVGAEAAPLRQARPATLFGRGKVEAVGDWREETLADVVVVDDALTPVQQRNLERAWGVKVIDRTGLILEIFGRRARTKEGRLQVELARLAYERSRLVRTWTHLERQRGGFGVMGGPGETQIETDRRLLAEKIARLKRDLDEVRRTRSLHRSARQRTPYPVIALVGYTNAGKSTLFNRLTASEVLAKDMLFATLDPTLRQVPLPGGRPAILSDTVGFISDLPHELVEAFRATLEEVQEADVIVHVRDAASRDFEAEGADVETVLSGLGVGDAAKDERVIEIWNKIDALDDDAKSVLELRAARRRIDGQAPAMTVSALTGQGCEAFLEFLSQRIDPSPASDVRLGPSDGEALAWLYRHGRVIGREDHPAGDVVVRVRLDARGLGQFESQFPACAKDLRAGALGEV